MADDKATTKKTTSSNKNLGEHNLTNPKVVLSRVYVPQSLISPLETVQLDEENNKQSVAGLPPIKMESSGRTLRARGGKENKNTEAANKRVNLTKTKAAEKPAVATRISRRNKKDVDPMEVAVERKEATDNKTKKKTRGNIKENEDPNKVAGNAKKAVGKKPPADAGETAAVEPALDDIPKMKELKVNVVRLSAKTIEDRKAANGPAVKSKAAAKPGEVVKSAPAAKVDPPTKSVPEATKVDPAAKTRATAKSAPAAKSAKAAKAETTAKSGSSSKAEPEVRNLRNRQKLIPEASTNARQTRDATKKGSKVVKLPASPPSPSAPPTKKAKRGDEKEITEKKVQAKEVSAKDDVKVEKPISRGAKAKQPAQGKKVISSKEKKEIPVKEATVPLVESHAPSEQVPSTSKLAGGKSLKLIEIPEEPEDDPYSFEMSQTDKAPRHEKKAKKRAIKSKPGNTMDLLLKQKTLQTTEYSCSVQHNRKLFEAEREQVEKQINVPAPIVNKFVVKDRPSRASPAAPTKASGSAAQPFHSKVWHSPQTVTSPARSESPVSRTVSNSPPIQSTFAKRITESITSRNMSMPLRVSGNLPKAFYMGLSGDDGTPSFSSDLVEKDREPLLDTSEKQDASGSAPRSHSLRSHRMTSSAMFSDSNAENVEPHGIEKSPLRKKNKESRSPLKALPLPTLPEGDPSSLSVYNATFDQSIQLSSVKVVLKSLETSADLNEMCEQASDDSTVLDPEVRNSFGFDELLEQSQETSKDPPVGISDNVDVRQRLQHMKQYLPSHHNKNRDRTIFPTSPTKRSSVFSTNEGATTSKISNFFSSSTPVGTYQKTSAKTSFANMSEITEISEIADEPSKDEDNANLFQDQSELANVSQIDGIRSAANKINKFLDIKKLRRTQATSRISQPR